MAAFIFVARGIGLAVAAALCGLAVVALIEVWVAHRDPGRWRAIRARGFFDNLKHMLN